MSAAGLALLAVAAGWQLLAVAYARHADPAVRSALHVVVSVMGHGWLCAWLVHEVWAVTGATGSARAVLTSLVLALYGTAVLVGGFVLRRVRARWVGLAFLALTLGKLALWDVWSLERVYQMLIMIGVGALLLGAGFLYARYSERLKREFLAGDADVGAPPDRAGELR